MIPSRRALVGVLLGMVVASFAFPNMVLGESPQVGGYAAVQDTDGSGARLRSAIWSNVLRNLPEGTTAQVLDEDTDSDGDVWYQVDVSGTQGWVYGAYLRQISKGGGYAAVQNTDGSGARLRSAPWSGVLRNLPEGTPAQLLDEDTDSDGGVWYQVDISGTQGWVYGAYLEQISQDEMERRQATSRGGIRSTVADLALQYVGYRYVWGGTSPQTGFDSSGFLYYVYKTMGRPIPRDYWGMMAQGEPVAKNQLQPGDLVFFVNTYKSGLSHGGIYIGNGQFVHATDERSGVKIDSLWSDYYAWRYYGARRML